MLAVIIFIQSIKCEWQFGLNNDQQQRKMTLPTLKNGAHSKQSEMFTLITGSKLCHCRSCFFCVEDQVAGGSGAKQNIEGLQHEGNLDVQSAFLKDVQSLTVVIQDMDNQLLEERNDLFGSRRWPGSIQQVCR